MIAIRKFLFAILIGNRRENTKTAQDNQKFGNSWPGKNNRAPGPRKHEKIVDEPLLATWSNSQAHGNASLS